MTTPFLPTPTALATQTHPALYTIHLVTPLVPSSSDDDYRAFEYALGQQELQPALTGRPCTFFRRHNPTACAWTHMLLLHGPSIPLPLTGELEVKQRWHFTVASQNPWVVRYSRQGGGVVNEDQRDASPVTDMGPCLKDLSQALEEIKYRNDVFLYVVTFVDFSGVDSEGKARYRDTVAKLRDSHVGFEENEWGMYVHLAGPVKQKTKLVGIDEEGEKEYEADAMDWVTVTSFFSAKGYADWLQSEEHRMMVGEGDGMVKETMVLTQPIFLPMHKRWEGYQFDVFGK